MSTKKINNLQREVSEVTHLLKDNVEKVLERGDNLDRLQTRSENLEVGATSFHRHAVTLKKTMCCKNFKMGVVLCIVVLLLIAVIVAVILATEGAQLSKNRSGSGDESEKSHNTPMGEI